MTPGPILNGDFESNEIIWSIDSSIGINVIEDVTEDFLADPPPSGTKAAHF